MWLGLRIKDIRREVAAAFDITEQELVSRSREHRFSHPRQIGMALAREMTDKSYPFIAREFGRHDHTTVLFAVRAVRARIAADPKLAEAYAKIRQRILDRYPQIAEPAAQELPMLKPVRLHATLSMSSAWSQAAPAYIVEVAA